jgi:hypothetical protein
MGTGKVLQNCQRGFESDRRLNVHRSPGSQGFFVKCGCCARWNHSNEQGSNLPMRDYQNEAPSKPPTSVRPFCLFSQQECTPDQLNRVKRAWNIDSPAWNYFGSTLGALKLPCCGSGLKWCGRLTDNDGQGPMGFVRLGPYREAQPLAPGAFHQGLDLFFAVDELALAIFCIQ